MQVACDWGYRWLIRCPNNNAWTVMGWIPSLLCRRLLLCICSSRWVRVGGCQVLLAKHTEMSAVGRAGANAVSSCQLPMSICIEASLLLFDRHQPRISAFPLWFSHGHCYSRIMASEPDAPSMRWPEWHGIFQNGNHHCVLVKVPDILLRLGNMDNTTKYLTKYTTFALLWQFWYHDSYCQQKCKW